MNEPSRRVSQALVLALLYVGGRYPFLVGLAVYVVVVASDITQYLRGLR